MGLLIGQKNPKTLRSEQIGKTKRRSLSATPKRKVEKQELKCKPIKKVESKEIPKPSLVDSPSQLIKRDSYGALMKARFDKDLRMLKKKGLQDEKG